VKSYIPSILSIMLVGALAPGILALSTSAAHGQDRNAGGVESSTKSFEVGTKVEVRVGEKWYSATVLQKLSNGYMVRTDVGSDVLDRTNAQVRALGSAGSDPHGGESNAANPAKTTDNNQSGPSALSPSGKTAPAATPGLTPQQFDKLYQGDILNSLKNPGIRDIVVNVDTAPMMFPGLVTAPRQFTPKSIRIQFPDLAEITSIHFIPATTKAIVDGITPARHGLQYIVDLENGDFQRLTLPPGERICDYSPDGENVAVLKNEKIHIWSIKNPQKPILLKSFDSDPIGKRRREFFAGKFTHQGCFITQVLSMEYTGLICTEIATSKVLWKSPFWGMNYDEKFLTRSADARQLAFISRDPDDGHSGKDKPDKLFIMEPVSFKILAVIPVEAAGLQNHNQFTPDGSGIRVSTHSKLQLIDIPNKLHYDYALPPELKLGWQVVPWTRTLGNSSVITSIGFVDLKKQALTDGIPKVINRKELFPGPNSEIWQVVPGDGKKPTTLVWHRPDTSPLPNQ
jgi:hypothetical protein